MILNLTFLTLSLTLLFFFTCPHLLPRTALVCNVPHRAGLLPTGNSTANVRMDLSYMISDIIKPVLNGFLTLILGI